MIRIHLNEEMEIPMELKSTAAALLCALAAPLAAAHSLWIESAGADELQAVYGEPEIRLIERSPGKLDSLALTRAQRGGAPVNPPLIWRQQGAGFALPGGKAATGAVVEARSTTARRSASSPGGAHALYYARRAAWPLAPTAPAMTLDIVPTSDPNTFAVHFNGAPLKHGTMKVIAPSLWLQVHDIDEGGLVRIRTPWRGQYVLDVDTREQRAGEIEGQRYDTVVHRATLSFTTPEGPLFENPHPAQYRAD
jgi:hypothetical protein